VRYALVICRTDEHVTDDCYAGPFPGMVSQLDVPLRRRGDLTAQAESVVQIPHQEEKSQETNAEKSEQGKAEKNEGENGEKTEGVKADKSEGAKGIRVNARRGRSEGEKGKNTRGWKRTSKVGRAVMNYTL
jgi:hypothetical protein